METIKVIITKGKDQFGAWAEDIPGIYGTGDTVREVKGNINDAISLYKKHNTEIPSILEGEYIIEWNFDTASFLEYISVIFTKSGLERLTGINQKQLGHYASGVKKPRKAQIEKIDSAIHRLVDDLSQVHLI